MFPNSLLATVGSDDDIFKFPLWGEMARNEETEGVGLVNCRGLLFTSINCDED